MTGAEFAGAAMSALDSVMQTIREIQTRIARIETEDRRVAEQRAAAEEFHRKEESNE
jgi:hypothetical protein